MSDKVKDCLEHFHDYGAYYPTRTIEIKGDIDSDLADKVLRNIHILDNYSQGTINILIKSDGGDVSHGLEIYNAIRFCKNYVRMIATGPLESMATVIFQAGDERLVYPDAYFMVHEGEAKREGTEKDIKEQKKMHDWQEKRCNNIYLDKIKEKKPRYTMDKLTKLMDRDRVLLPEELIELGLADKIIKEAY